ncbi:MAG: putative toxin-antitoxin system toxin component, PIN family [Phycisphaerae bacterium]
MTAGVRVVFDCNVFLQALISPGGPAGRCVTMSFQRKVALFCTTQIIQELRETASDPRIRARFTRLTDATLAALVENIERIAVFLRHVPETFTYPRDPDDAHYINVALAAEAKYVVSRDKDLLDLMDRGRPEAREFRRRFPTLEIIEPQVLLRLISSKS